MKLYEDFCRSNESFEDRVGEPDALSAAVGHVVFAHSYLAQRIDNEIAGLVGVDETLAPLTEVTPFIDKLTAMSALVLGCRNRRFNTGRALLRDRLRELIAVCKRAHELRCLVVDSRWHGLPYLDGHGFSRRVLTSGVEVEHMDAKYVQDIADFIIATADDVQEFFIHPSSHKEVGVGDNICNSLPS